MVASQVVIRLVPIVACLFVANVGSQIGDVLRLTSVWNSATTPVILPILVPAIQAGAFILTVPDFLAMCGALFAGGTACFIAASNRGFGIRVSIVRVSDCVCE
eukprot:COSAG05_NODE_2234_length_3350_cov_2.022093_1_plen_103_part_00